VTLDPETVRLAYRLFLAREPAEAEVSAMQAMAGSVAGLHKAFLNAPEFKARIPQRPPSPLDHFAASFDARALIAAFAVPGLAPGPGVVTNFLGARIPPGVFPQILERMAGKLEPPPDPGNWHADIAEWAAALRSVDLARGSYRILELGCGWGCWLTNMGVAARARGLAVDLIGIEGDAGHLGRAREVLLLNGFAEDDFRLVHGVAGPRPGLAIFPRPEGMANWGGQAQFHPDAETLARARANPALQVLDCHTIPELAGNRPIDLLHIDIQGAEAAFVEGNLEHMAGHVRRVLIGTHSRAIEGALTTRLLDAGWRLEMERPAVVTIHAHRPVCHVDGVQMWANPAGAEA
jgi:hypothetical protein